MRLLVLYFLFHAFDLGFSVITTLPTYDIDYTTDAAVYEYDDSSFWSEDGTRSELKIDKTANLSDTEETKSEINSEKSIHNWETSSILHVKKDVNDKNIVSLKKINNPTPYLETTNSKVSGVTKQNYVFTESILKGDKTNKNEVITSVTQIKNSFENKVDTKQLNNARNASSNSDWKTPVVALTATTHTVSKVVQVPPRPASNKKPSKTIFYNPNSLPSGNALKNLLKSNPILASYVSTSVATSTTPRTSLAPIPPSTTTIVRVPPRPATNKKPSKTIFYNPNSLPSGNALKNLLKSNPILANYVSTSVATSTTPRTSLAPIPPSTTTIVRVPPRPASNKKPSKTIFYNPNSLPSGNALKNLLKSNPILASYVSTSVATSTTPRTSLAPIPPSTTTIVRVPPRPASNKKPSKTIFYNPNSLPSGNALKNLLKSNPILANYVSTSVATSTTPRTSLAPIPPSTTTIVRVPPRPASNKKPSKTIFYNPNSLPSGNALKNLLKSNPILANYVSTSVATSTTPRTSLAPIPPSTTTIVRVPPRPASNKKPSKTIFYNPNSLPSGNALKNLLKSNPILASYVSTSVATSTTPRTSLAPIPPSTTTIVRVPPRPASNKKPSKTIFYNPNSLPSGNALKNLLKSNPILANYVSTSVATSTTPRTLLPPIPPSTTTIVRVPPRPASNKKPSKTIFYNPNSLPSGNALKNLLKSNPILASYVSTSVATSTTPRTSLAPIPPSTTTIVRVPPRPASNKKPSKTIFYNPNSLPSGNALKNLLKSNPILANYVSTSVATSTTPRTSLAPIPPSTTTIVRVPPRPASNKKPSKTIFYNPNSLPSGNALKNLLKSNPILASYVSTSVATSTTPRTSLAPIPPSTTTIVRVPPRPASNKKPSKTIFYNPNSLPSGNALKNLLKSNPILASYVSTSVATSTTPRTSLAPIPPSTTTIVRVPPRPASNKKPSKTIFYNPNSLPSGNALKNLLKSNPILASYVSTSVATSTTPRTSLAPIPPSTTIIVRVPPRPASNKKPSKTIFYNPNSLPSGNALKNLLKSNPILASYVSTSVATSTTPRTSLAPIPPSTTTIVRVPPRPATNKKPSKTIFYNPNSLPSGNALNDLLKNNPSLANRIFVPTQLTTSKQNHIFSESDEIANSFVTPRFDLKKKFPNFIIKDTRDKQIQYSKISGNVLVPTDPPDYDFDYTTGEAEIENEIDFEVKATSPTSTVNLGTTVESTTISAVLNATANTDVQTKVDETLKNRKENRSKEGPNHFPAFVPPFAGDENGFPTELPVSIEPPRTLDPKDKSKDPFSDFFRTKWQWILLGLVGVIFLFCLPGMIIQIFCHKFYQAYRREKDRDEEEGTPKLLKSRKLLTSDSISRGSDSFSRASECFNERISEKSSSNKRLDNVSSQSRQSLVAAITPASARSNRTGSRSMIVSPELLRDTDVPDDSSLRRVDVYTGPPLMPFSFSTPPELPPKLNCTPPVSIVDEFSPPQLPPKSSRSQQVDSYPSLHQPQDGSNGTSFDQIRTPSAEDASSENVEARFDFAQQGNTLLSQRPPALPPKPKQYKIRPLSDEQKEEVKQKEKRKSTQSLERLNENNRKQTKRPPKTTRVSRDQTGKPVKSSKKRSESDVDGKREQRRRSNSKSQARVKRRSTLIKDSEESARKLEQLQKQEALLRQILQGISEAEMLKAKLQQTKNRTKEQEAFEINPRPEHKRSHKPDKYERKRMKSSRKVHEDRPPSYTRTVTPS